jgi:hypothetical protein
MHFLSIQFDFPNQDNPENLRQFLGIEMMVSMEVTA